MGVYQQGVENKKGIKYSQVKVSAQYMSSTYNYNMGHFSPQREGS